MIAVVREKRRPTFHDTEWRVWLVADGSEKLVCRHGSEASANEHARRINDALTWEPGTKVDP